MVAELPPDLLATPEQRGGIEPGHVPAELVVLLGPLADRRQPRPECVGHDVLGITHEDRAVPDPREALHVLDHLLVVVGREEGLALAAVGHRQPAHEVGHPRERGPLELGVLVQVVIDVPRLVADHEVVLTIGNRIVEHHEVGDQDLVHPPDRLECVEVVLVGLGGDVAGLAGELGAQRMDALAACLEDGGHGVLRKPLDLELGTNGPQLVRDGHVALGVPEADGRRQEECPPRARQAAGPRARGRRPGGGHRGHLGPVAGSRSTNSRISRLVRTGSRAGRMCPEPSNVTSSPPVARGQRLAMRVTDDAVLGSVQHENGAANLSGELDQPRRGRRASVRPRSAAASRHRCRGPSPRSPRSAWSNAARGGTRRRRIPGSPR